MTTPGDERLREAIHATMAKRGYFSRPLENDLLDAVKAQLGAAQQDGHFFVKKEMKGGAIDYRCFWFCKCDYRANGKEELNGHISWKLAELRNHFGIGEDV